ncbi:MAG: calcium-translocating P-type ATPase, PMCA-type [Oscillospiraceae bacterium]|nr:calcium-translocating P-type ATPase, PMCA-type [Oscillospiraceae bacterium]
MKFHTGSLQEVLKHLDTAQEGLTSPKVKERREKYGSNELKQAKPKTLFQRFLDQFKDAMIIILLVAAAVSFAIACVEGEPKEFFEPGLILLIVVLNAILGVMQESKAEKALEALKSMSAPHCRVIRQGEEQIIESAELVPGDIIRLEAGDFVPADARLIKSVNLKCEESALTGESVPSDKDAGAVIEEKAPLGDRSNMIYSGCSVSYGTAMAVVTATGMDTEMGKIANLLQGEQDSQTPLQKKLAQLGKYLGFMALGVCAIIFAIGLASGLELIEIFMTAVSLAVSAIPEGLPAIVTIVLSIGVQRLAKQNAVIRRLPAVETLGGASVICSDKTGTLTQNRMTLMKAYIEGKTEDIHRENSQEIRKLLSYATLCCDGSIRFENGQVQHIGDPTETAIILAAHNNGLVQGELNMSHPRVAELPFDSDRKLMTSVNVIDGKLVVIVKGAFDMMVPRCIKGDLETARKMNDEMSACALRVISVAYKEIEALPEDLSTLEQGLHFYGLLGMIDPPRPEAAEAVRTCLRAGIKPVMITGDHVVTASAIAKSLGILQPGQRAITGAELDAMTEEELDAQVEQISVYARVSPENKIRIVKAWQKKDQVVAMTGDGVNDAPALKAADIGCAMGITGTDVAKGASDMTLSDDNFATIVEAVREGRSIYRNIKKVVGFLLGTNIGEVITVFVAMLLWKKTPLLSMQLLWINLVTDSLPAVALGMEPIEAGVMDEKPRPKKEGLFANGLGIRIALQGCLFGLLSLTAYYVGERFGGTPAHGQTMAFAVLALSQIVQAYNMRSDRSIFKIGVFGNKTLNKAAAVSFVLMLLVLFTPVRTAFGLVTLPLPLYLIALGLIIAPLILMELAKALKLIK